MVYKPGHKACDHSTYFYILLSENRNMAVISMKSLFEAGVHYGHKTERWHPKMKEYIYGSKGGIYILDLRKSLASLKEVYNQVSSLTANGGGVLFLGNQILAPDFIAEKPFAHGDTTMKPAWLGGMLTNFQTVKASIAKLKKYDELRGPEGNYPGVLKKEASRFEKERKKLEAVLGGIADMRKNPVAVFIVDLRRESIALNEAKKLGIPVIAVVDSNCDPRGVDFVIPGNDDSAHAIELYAQVVAAASIEGRKTYEATAGKVEQSEGRGSKAAHADEAEEVDEDTDEPEEGEIAEVTEE